MKSPHNYPRRVLVLVSGLSPQIVTETLYGLMKQEHPFIPTEVHLITTSKGAKLAKNALLHPNEGYFRRLQKEFPAFMETDFTLANIHQIKQGSNPIDDIRSQNNNALAADLITKLMAGFSEDDNTAIHACIAGGRKTMGFFLGYAFSLFARPQDRLSHVLVSPPFEGHPEFFFPPKKSSRLTTRDGKHLDTNDAHISLAEIPVVQLRQGRPKSLIGNNSSYIETVNAIQDSFNPPSVRIDLLNKRIILGEHQIPLGPALLAWASFWASSSLNNNPWRTWRDIDPYEFLDHYELIVGAESSAFENAQKRITPKMTKKFFEENNSKLMRAFKNTLGPAAKPYLLSTRGERNNTQKAWIIPPDCIDISQ